MRIEIFVVKTKIDASMASNDKEDQILARKAEWKLINVRNLLIKAFGGLTVIPNANGFWINKSGLIEGDSVEIWLIYTDIEDSKLVIRGFAKQIKKITAQDSQAFGIDGKLFFV
jgi:hypothetical protein